MGTPHHSISTMYKLLFTLLSLVHLSSSLLSSDQFCGPQECGLLCEGGQECVEDDQVNCCCEPCCAQWSCVSVPPIPPTAECPEVRPEFNSPCRADEEGLHCDYGTQECCGEVYPEISMECSYNVWIGYYVDTLCILGLAPPCPDDTTTTTTEPLEYDDTTTTTTVPLEYDETTTTTTEPLEYDDTATN